MYNGKKSRRSSKEGTGAGNGSSKKQARADAKATARAEKEAALKDYADTYAQMDPAQAAAIFDEMMAGDPDTVVKILKNIASNKRGAIIENMTTLSAAQVTKLME